MSPLCSGKGWIMCNMGDSNTRRGLFFSLCAAITVFSLAAHFVADAACRSPERLAARSGHSATNNTPAANMQLTTSGLHTGFAAPLVTPMASPVALALAVVSVSVITLSRFVSPPLQPPTALAIA